MLAFTRGAFPEDYGTYMYMYVYFLTFFIFLHRCLLFFHYILFTFFCLLFSGSRGTQEQFPPATNLHQPTNHRTETQENPPGGARQNEGTFLSQTQRFLSDN